MNGEWSMPLWIFQELHEEFRFTVDAAADHGNALLPRYWDKAVDGLVQDWDAERVWCNPPYGQRQAQWIEKGHGSKGLVVMLLPVRTETEAWHRWVLHMAEVRFLRGRLWHSDAEGNTGRAPFASAVVIWNGGTVGSEPKGAQG